MEMKVFSPNTIDKAARQLELPGGQLIAGGTDLIIELRKGEKKPEFLVDISNISELKVVHIDNDKIKLGAAVTFGEIIDNEYLKNNIPSLWDMALNMGACQIQNRATIGGNICNAAPAADSIPVFLSLNAHCIIYSSKGRRSIPIDELVTGSGKNSLEAGEFLEAVEFTAPKDSFCFAFSKLGKRNALAISTISCAVKLKLKKGIIAEASICTGSLGSTAIREKSTEAYLLNKDIKQLDIEKASEVLSLEVEERLKGRSTIAFKKIAVKGVFKEALQKCIEQVKDVKSNE